MTQLTSVHIDMFAKAKKLQEGWKPEYGDMVAVISRNHGIEFK